ncbi:uncharacterized protein L969DRAFT_309718 [Mixia osmundae IAM 14324]|uniref:uncharacterized protein n=1 Tax=Mixia osmundae (strain CBS 9802 / IAM 14324 / JCM 22182 / KY 12970) TaxID=764103 RepID=UPI0004A54D02|nr:uncharacterized protein L969DRAFT_309718 [Mixia osmundae IAM 14324]KEI41451.1 hypothetical protein L969DRAFT_309718 [Mixia osmundae IAM 14324]
MASFDIFTACLNGQANLVASAISRDHELINKQDPNSDGRTALHHACTAGSLDTVTALLSTNRADVNARDGSGFTPLLVACAAGQLGIVQALIGAGADVTATNARGQTGLHYAASRGNVPVATALLAKGADVNARDRGGQLPLFVFAHSLDMSQY